MPLTFKRCTETDIDIVLDISRQTFRDTFGPQNDPKDFEVYMETAFTRNQVLDELSNQQVHFYLAYNNGDSEPVGYFKVNKAGAQTDINEPGSMELERIYLVKDYQGRGLGVELIGKAIEISTELNAAYLWLGVWDQNTRAIRFYEKSGFVKFGEHPFIIGEDKQTDWLMKLKINGA